MYGSYYGDGNKVNSHFTNLGYLPKVVIVIGDAEGGTGAANPRKAETVTFINTGNFACIEALDDVGTTRYADTDGVRDSRLELVTTASGFTIQNPSTSFNTIWANKNGVRYTYVIYK